MIESKYFLIKIKCLKHLLIGLCVICAAVVLELYVIKNYRNEINNAVEFNNVNSFNQYTYIDVKNYSDKFATHKNDETKKSLYFVKDEKYIYIAAIMDKEVKNLPDRIYGYTHTIPNDLKEIAINTFNSDEINEDTFHSYFGIYYIDTYESPIDDLIGFSVIILIISFVGVGFIISYLLKNKHNKKVIELYGIEKIKQEIDSNNTISNHLGKAYLTSKNIISYCSKLSILNLNDIIWIYPHTCTYNGKEYYSLVATTKEGKAITIAMYSTSNKRAKQSFDEFYQSIMIKNMDILYGYTAENMKKADKIIKN